MKNSINFIKKVGFIGLGKMGYPIAMNINKSKSVDTYVWNRTYQRAIEHSQTYKTKTVYIKEIFSNADIILICLPTYKEVFNIINDNIEFLKKDVVIIDCTSSDPFKQKELHEILLKYNVHLLDAPVSGGPSKAFSGTLSSMVSGNYDVYCENKYIFDLYSNNNHIYVGECGNGSAIKCINNLLNMTNLCVASEGLKALQDFGIDINTSLNVINVSSGRSLMTTERIPKHILKHDFDYGFSMKLMEKDINTAVNLIDLPLFAPTIQNLIKNRMKKNGENIDYTYIFKEFFDKT